MIKKDNILLIFLCLFLAISYIYLENNKKIEKVYCYEDMYLASEKLQDAFELIKERKKELDIQINSNIDINETGMIGVDYNGITTTLGSIEAKRTTCNPNIAALFIKLLNEAGIKKGDKVAINLSSSFPALNIAAIISCEHLGVEPVIITSIGSSTWGGNNIEFPYIMMENYLYNLNVIKNKSIAISPGGSGDIGKDMDSILLNKILTNINKYDNIIIYEEDLKKNIDTRYKIYKEKKAVDGLINVGGNLVSFGDTQDMEKFLYGVLLEKRYKENDNTGLVQKYNNMGVPVISMLNIKKMAEEYGISIDPKGLPDIGVESIYYEINYKDIYVYFSLIISFFILFMYKRRYINENNKKI